MKKSFKKAIAVMLATLMIVCSLPFTAFAAPGDYTPNINLRFGTFYDGENGSWTDYTQGGASGYTYSGIFDAPVTWNQKAGTLTLEAADTVAIAGSVGIDPLDSDYVYGVGDYFTVTIIWENITKCSIAACRLNYPDNIEPAGLYSYKSGRNTKYTLASVSEADAQTAAGTTYTLVDGGNYGVKAMSTGAFYSTMDTLMDTSYVDETPSTVNTKTDREIYDAHSSTGCQDLKTNTISGVTHPETGALDYNYSDQDVMIGQTFAFKITGEGAIDFTLTDPNNTIAGNYSGGYYIADQTADGTTRDMYTTYAPNFWNQDLVAEDPENVPERAGSRKITYLGTNIHNGSTSTDTEFTFTPADGREAVKVTAADSATALASAPANSDATTATNNDGTHTTTTYSGWTLGEDGVTFTETSSASTVDCTLNYTANGDATCEADGTKTATCPDCGYVSTVADTDSATGHDYNVTPVSNNNGTHTYTCANGCGASKTEDCTYSSAVTKDPTLTETGIRTFTCTECGHSYTEDIPVLTCTHTNTTKTNEVPATCTEDGTEAYWTCDDCGKMFSDEACANEISAPVVINAPGHTPVTDEAVAATCISTGLTEGSHCSVCDAVIVAQQVTDIDPDNHTDIVIDMPLAETCTDTGLTEGSHCEACGTVIVEQETTNALDHDYVEVIGSAVASTCTVAGKKADQKCSRCGDIITGAALPLADHTPVSADNAVDPTFDAPGKEADTVCSVCGTTLAEGAVIPALEGVSITVAATDMGTTTLNGDDATNGVATKVLKNSAITLTATPVEGAEFVGWAVGNKIVSEAATFTTTAIADVVYTPVFTATEATTFTVVFVDAYGNVISTQSVAAGTDIVEPDAPARAGYTFAGWSLTAEEIDALAAGATIVANYTKDAVTTYTVTATGCNITVDGTTVQDSATGIAYDTQVTVTAAGATAWTIDGATVAYGESYTFYVGSDVTLVPTFEPAVTAKPTVAAVSVNPITGSYKYAYLATYSMEAGFTEISHGFLYGKNVDAADLAIENAGKTVNGHKVYAVYAQSKSEQFSLNVGTTTSGASITAKAFLAYVDNSTGDTVVIYAEPQSHTFA